MPNILSAFILFIKEKVIKFSKEVLFETTRMGTKKRQRVKRVGSALHSMDNENLQPGGSV